MKIESKFSNWFDLILGLLEEKNHKCLFWPSRNLKLRRVEKFWWRYFINLKFIFFINILYCFNSTNIKWPKLKNKIPWDKSELKSLFLISVSESLVINLPKVNIYLIQLQRYLKIWPDKNPSRQELDSQLDLSASKETKKLLPT